MLAPSLLHAVLGNLMLECWSIVVNFVSWMSVVSYFTDSSSCHVFFPPTGSYFAALYWLQGIRAEGLCNWNP